jgi:membrane protease YdiL (CAAX protease family)
MKFLISVLSRWYLLKGGVEIYPGIVWVFSKILNRTKPIVYWIGIMIAAIIFAIGHFPVAYQAVENPSTGLLAYILIGNSIGGVIFG